MTCVFQLHASSLLKGKYCIYPIASFLSDILQSTSISHHIVDNHLSFPRHGFHNTRDGSMKHYSAYCIHSYKFETVVA
jgi:hypothetical protein